MCCNSGLGLKISFWSLTSILTPILFFWLLINTIGFKDRYWNERKCYITKVTDNIDIVFNLHSTYVYRGAYIKFNHNNTTFNVNGTVVCIKLDSGSQADCNWVTGKSYLCWVYNTFPKVPTGTLGTVIYNLTHNPNDTIPVTIVLISLVLVIGFVGFEIVSVMHLVSVIKKYRKYHDYGPL